MKSTNEKEVAMNEAEQKNELQSTIGPCGIASGDSRMKGAKAIAKQCLALALLPLALSGCIDSTVDVAVNKDGSAEVTYREFYAPSVTKTTEAILSVMTNSMPGASGGSNIVTVTDEGMTNKVKQHLKDLGEGASVVSSTATTNAAGWKGFVAVYSVKDINKAVVSIRPGQNDSGYTTDSSEKYTFKFTPGATARLLIIPPEKKTASEEPTTEAETGTANTDAENEMAENMAQAMMAPLLKGMHFGFVVRVNGKITETNADHARTPDTITVMDIQMDKLLADPEGKKLMGKDNPEDTRDLSAMKIPGLEVEEEGKTIDIQFK